MPRSQDRGIFMPPCERIRDFRKGQKKENPELEASGFSFEV